MLFGRALPPGPAWGLYQVMVLLPMDQSASQDAILPSFETFADRGASPPGVGWACGLTPAALCVSEGQVARPLVCADSCV